MDEDEIERLMRHMNVPKAVWHKVRQQLKHALSEHGQARLAMEKENPMNTTAIPVPPGARFTKPGGLNEDMIMEDAMADAEDMGPTLSDYYLQDLQTLRETIELCMVIGSDGTAKEKTTLLPKLQALRDVLVNNMAARADDTMSMLQMNEHDRRNQQARVNYGRWQTAVSEGRTQKSYKSWLSEYELQEDPGDQRDTGKSEGTSDTEAGDSGDTESDQ